MSIKRNPIVSVRLSGPKFDMFYDVLDELSLSRPDLLSGSMEEGFDNYVARKRKEKAEAEARIQKLKAANEKKKWKSDEHSGYSSRPSRKVINELILHLGKSHAHAQSTSNDYPLGNVAVSGETTEKRLASRRRNNERNQRPPSIQTERQQVTTLH